MTRIAVEVVVDRRLVELEASTLDPWAALAAYAKRIEDDRAAIARAELERIANSGFFQHGTEAHDFRPLPLRAWTHCVGRGNYGEPGPVALRSVDVIA